MKNEINHKNNHPAASHDSDGSKIGNRLNIYGKRLRVKNTRSAEDVD